MNKIRILYLITGLNPGGAELMLRKIIKNLDRSRYDLYVCTLTNPGIISHEIRTYVKKIYCLNANVLKHRLSAVFKLRKLLHELKPQILHCFMIHSNLLGRFASIGMNMIVLSSIRVKLIMKK